MPKIVVHSAVVRCDQGSAPSALTAATARATRVESLRAATVQDVVPTTNLASFGLCRAPTNPQVAAATSAAQGTLQPQPCVPATGTPWSGGDGSVKIGGVVALTSTARCQCKWGGTITIATAGTAHTRAGA